MVLTPGNKRKVHFLKRCSMEDFSKLAIQYTPMIHQIIQTLSIYKNKDDFFQIGLIALWEAQTKFDENKGRFLNFAYTSVKGRMLNELAKQHREERKIPLQMDSYCYDSILQLETILSYTETLTVKQKNWVLLTFIENLSLPEIADKLEVSVAAVKSWRSSALQKLRKELLAQELIDNKIDSTV